MTNLEECAAIRQRLMTRKLELRAELKAIDQNLRALTLRAASYSIDLPGTALFRARICG